MGDDPDHRNRFEQSVLNRLREIFDRHRWLITTEYVQGSVALAGAVRDLTDRPVMAVGAAQGAGELPPDLPFEVLTLGMDPGSSMVETMHRGQALLAEPNPEHQAVVDGWDQDHAARSVASFTSIAGRSMGRRTFGARPARWRVLEDKLIIESIWAAAEIPVAASRQVEVTDLAGLLSAHDELAGPSGTVWAGDNSSGWHGGGAGTFWVPDRAVAARLQADLGRFERIRVMPFVDGVPCSMHGMVVPDGSGGNEVISFRPCEMLVLRDRERHAFVYCRSANFWDPDPADRAAMTESTRRIGRELVAMADYRGMFTVDGVMGAEGFLPTEVNTRYGAALRGRHPTVSGEELNLILLNMAVIEGQFDDIDLRPLGPIVTRALDEDRHGHAFVACSARPDRERTATISRTSAGELVLTETIEEEDGQDHSDRHHSDRHHADEAAPVGGKIDRVMAKVQWTTMGADGGVVNVTIADYPIGQSVAPLLADAIRLADQQWSLGVASLEPATPVR